MNALKDIATVAHSDIRETDEITAFTDTRSTIRAGFLTLVLGLGGFLLWAAYAPLDEGVPASATVVIDTKRKSIQHFTGGVIERVRVKEGTRVKAGDVLVELNSGTAKANFESVRQNYLSQRAIESRLMAELANESSIKFHADVMNEAQDSVVQQQIFTQNQLFQSRRSALREELGAMSDSLGAMEAQYAGIGNQLESRSIQASRQTEQLRNVADLAKEGFAPRNQALQLEQSQAELRAIMDDLQASRARLQRSMAEIQKRMNQRKQETVRDAAQQLAEIRREVQANRERLNSISSDLRREQIKAPVDGQVVGLTSGSVGGVVSPGQKLMDIVPIDEALVLEAKFPVNVIDRVKAGDTTAIRFSAFAHSPQLVVEGVIKSISSDVVNENMGAGVVSYYLARIEVTEAGIKQLGTRIMQPGMQGEVLINTGERSVLDYLLHPLTKRIAASMKEE